LSKWPQKKEKCGTDRSGFDSKSLTNYFIASNQVVNQLRSELNDSESFLLRKIQFLPASKAV